MPGCLCMGVASADIVVVGGGIIGMACASLLQRDGRQVTVVDPAPVGRGCSFGNAGLVALDHILPLARAEVLLGGPRMLVDPLSPLHLRWSGLPGLLPWLCRFALAARPGQVVRGTRVLADLLREAVPAWERLAKNAGVSALFSRQGYLTIFETPKAARAAEAENRVLQAHGIGFKMLKDADVKAMVPDLAAKIAAGRYHPDAIHTVDPFGVVRGILDRFVIDGGRVIDQQVVDFITEDGSVVGLRLNGGTVKANAVVVAAGVGAAALVRQLGVHAPLIAERGYHVMVDGTDIRLDTPLLFAERGFVATPMKAGLRLAGTVEFGAREPNWKRAESLRNQAATLFDRPGLTEQARWFGDRPTLPDYLPMISPAPHHRNVTLAFGHQHLGLTLAAITGEMVADLVQNRPLKLDIGALRSDRFR